MTCIEVLCIYVMYKKMNKKKLKTSQYYTNFITLG